MARDPQFRGQGNETWRRFERGERRGQVAAYDVNGAPAGGNASQLNSQPGSFYLARANHTGTQAAGTITGLAAIATSGSANDLTAGAVPAARMPALTGDVTTVAGAVATTLATVNANVGTFGSASQAGQFTVNAKGLITGASSVSISITASQVSDFAEAVDDRAAALIQNGTGITWSYNDAAGTLTPTVTITQYTDEMAQDAVGTILTDTATIDFTYNDAGNQITADVKADSIGVSQLAAAIKGAWTAYTPTLSASSGTLTTASAAGRYLQIGKTVFVFIQITITTKGTAGGYLQATAPVASVNVGADNIQMLNGRENAATGQQLTGALLNNSTTIQISFYNGADCMADARKYTLSGTYECA